MHLVWHSLTKGWCWNKRPPKKDHPSKVGQPAGCPAYFLQRETGANSLSQNLTVLPAPSGREPLACPQTLRLRRKLYRCAKGLIPEDDFPRSGEDVTVGDRGSSFPNPSGEKVVQKRPQAFLNHKCKKILSAEHGQSASGGHSRPSRPCIAIFFPE